MKLIKKKLEALPIPERQYFKDKHYEIKAEMQPYADGEILAVTIWYSLNDEPTYRIFIAKDSYITQMYVGTEQWSGAGISHHIDSYHYYYGYERKKDEYKVYSDEATLKLLRECSNVVNEESALWLVNHIQSRIRTKKTREKEEREQAIWDAELVTTPNEPADLSEWVRDKIFVTERYIFYETTRSDKKRGMCSHCGKKITLNKPKHGTTGVCPKCNSLVVYKNGNKQRYLNSKREEMQLVQKTTVGKVVLRNYSCWQDIEVDSWDKFKVKRVWSEGKRIFVDKARNFKNYYYELYKNKKLRFIGKPGGESYRYYGFDTSYVYMDGVEDILKALGGGMEYMPLEIFDHKISLERMLHSLHMAGIVERLWKRGLHSLAIDITNTYSQYCHEKGLFRNYKVENDDLRIFQLVDITLEELYKWPEIKKTGKRPTAAEIERTRVLKMSLSRLAELAKYSSIKKILNYMEQQVKEHGKTDSGMYKDYLNMLEELKMDIKSDFNLFPRNLKERHDELVEIKNEADNAKLKRRLDKSHSIIAKMEEELNEKYAVQNKTCFIRAPHSAYEIALEGQKLHHCVGGDSYRDKMKNRESYILFVRKKDAPEIPWWTIEVRNDHTIAQYHGWGNRDKDKEDVEPIMKVFRRRLKKLEAIDKREKEKLTIAAAV